MHEKLAPSYDVTIVGAGLAGLALARQLLLYTDKTVLLLDKRLNPPGPTQKVGESLVQTSGYYLSKVLDLEEHLFSEHYFKYNLRFQWKTPGLENRGLEDYSKSFIRMGSNLATFQLDRNLLETHLLEICRQDLRFHFEGGVGGLEADLAEQGPHRVAFSGKETRCAWIVDASGRGQFLKKKLGLLRENPIRHGFWVIPLHGKTSLGLVYDKSVVASEDVSTARKMLDYVCREFPLFERDLPHRKILDEGRFFDYSYDAQQTISPQRRAMTGEAPLLRSGLQPRRRSDIDLQHPHRGRHPDRGSSELGPDLFTDEEFLPFFMRKFGLLGPINRMLQQFLSDFFQWKKTNVQPNAAPELHDFYQMTPLRMVGLTREEATEVLEGQFNSLKGFARWIVAQVYSTVLRDPMIAMNTEFINSIKLRDIRFDPSQMRAEYNSPGEKSKMAVA